MRFKSLVLASLMTVIPSLAAASTINLATGNAALSWVPPGGTPPTDHPFLSDYAGSVGHQQEIQNLAIQSNGGMVTDSIGSTTPFPMEIPEVLLAGGSTPVWGANGIDAAYLTNAPWPSRRDHAVAFDRTEFAGGIKKDGWHGNGNSGNGHDRITTTPEPGTLVLLGTGVVGLAMRRRKTRSPEIPRAASEGASGPSMSGARAFFEKI